MTEPTDQELAALRDQFGITSNGRGIREFTQVRDFARAVIAKWGTPPAVAGEHKPGCPALGGYGHGVEECCCGATPQPTQAQAGAVVVTTDTTGRCVAVTRQDEEGRVLSVIWQAPEAQAGAVPLTDEQIEVATGAKIGTPLFLAAKGFVLATEAAHGIGIKGGQHGAE